MNAVVKDLIQYQELCFSLSEQQASLTQTGLKRLETSMQKVQQKLPADLRDQIELLRQRSPLILAPVVRNACSACRQALPTALGFSIRTDEAVHRCPGCGRLLYIADETLRQTGKRVSPLFGVGVKTGIAQYSSEALMIPQLAAKTREAAIKELAAAIADQGFVEDSDALAEMALERERIASSAVEKGLAFPHVRGIEGGGLTLALGIKRGGLDFDASDGGKTKLIFFSVIPTAASQFYLKLLAALNQTFREPASRTRLLACKTAPDLFETLDELTAPALL